MGVGRKIPYCCDDEKAFKMPRKDPDSKVPNGIIDLSEVPSTDDMEVEDVEGENSWSDFVVVDDESNFGEENDDSESSVESDEVDTIEEESTRAYEDEPEYLGKRVPGKLQTLYLIFDEAPGFDYERLANAYELKFVDVKNSPHPLQFIKNTVSSHQYVGSFLIRSSPLSIADIVQLRQLAQCHFVVIQKETKRSELVEKLRSQFGWDILASIIHVDPSRGISEQNSSLIDSVSLILDNPELNIVEVL